MPAGRPTLYSEEILVELRKYILRSKDAEYNLPTKEDFAGLIGVNTDTIQEWQKVHEEFSVAIKELEQLQKHRLMSNGLISKFHPTMAIFLLKANHGLIETTKQVQEHHFMDMDDEQLDKLIKQKSAEAGVAESSE